MPDSGRAPAVFLAHASPMLALERDGHAEALRRFTLGAARADDRLEEVNRGFEYGNLSLSSYAFVPPGEGP